MSKPIQISIPTPCHENWDAMTPADKGRFCASYQKTVFDFTSSSDREIASILKNTNNACGRFRATQLDRDLVIPKEKSTLWMAASAAVVSFLTIGNHAVSAQTPVNTEQHVSETDDIIGKVAIPQKKIIIGSVLDSSSLPISRVTIFNRNTNIKTYSDLNGIFSIEGAKGDILEISHQNMLGQEILIRNYSNLEIILIAGNDFEYVILGGAVVGIEIQQRRSFFGRVFHSIGNIFR